MYYRLLGAVGIIILGATVYGGFHAVNSIEGKPETVLQNLCVLLLLATVLTSLFDFGVSIFMINRPDLYSGRYLIAKHELTHQVWTLEAAIYGALALLFILPYRKKHGI
jgi:hypothetical protein